MDFHGLFGHGYKVPFPCPQTVINFFGLIYHEVGVFLSSNWGLELQTSYALATGLYPTSQS